MKYNSICGQFGIAAMLSLLLCVALFMASLFGMPNLRFGASLMLALFIISIIAATLCDED